MTFDKNQLKRIKKLAESARVSCECVNWMGGCKGEFRCPYGVIRSIVRICEEKE